MRVGIHQPEHFPYLGYFQKIIDCDYFIILDNVKFKKNNWQNRNRYLNSRGEEEWFTVPVGRKANSKKIMDIQIEDGKWKTKIIKQMSQRFPKWTDYFEYIYRPNCLIDINMRSIYHCLDRIIYPSPLKVKIEEATGLVPTKWYIHLEVRDTADYSNIIETIQLLRV